MRQVTPPRASARHTHSDCSVDSMLRWNKHKATWASVWPSITTSLPDGHIFVERSFHKHCSARLWRHKEVEKQESVFNFSNTTNMLQVRQGYLLIQKLRRASQTTVTSAFWGCDVAVSRNLTKDESFKTHLKYLLLWQHFESTQTQQQNSRMWFKSSQWSRTEEKITCSAAHCYLHFISTLLLGTKMKRWDTQHKHTCFKLWGTYFLSFQGWNFRMN